MQRRNLLRLGLVSATALGLLGGAAALLEPGVTQARLSPAGRDVLAAVGNAALEGTLPSQPAARREALSGLLDRIDALVAGLPAHSQQELSQLLALLHSAPGRRVFAALSSPWPEASVRDVRAALQAMRTSPLALRQQAYQALHDLVGGAYFSSPATWAMLGYPGPQAV